MRRQLALRAEFLARGDEPDAENLLPEPVGEHAGRERVLRRDKPAGDGEAIGVALWQRRKRGRRARRNLLAEIQIVAAMLQLGHAALIGGQLALDRHRAGWFDLGKAFL